MPNTLTTTRLYQGTLGTSTATLYTVPVNTVTMIRNLWACNSNGSARTWTVYFVPSGSSPGDSNTLLGAVSVAGGDSEWYPIYLCLEAGDTIRGKASSSSSIGANISGVEITGAFGDIRPKRLAQGLCTTSPVTQYTVPTGKQVVLKQVIFCNLSSSDRTVRFDLVRAGQSPSSSSQIYNALALTANTTTTKRLSMLMDAGDTIRISASARNAVTVLVAGIEVAL